MDQGKERDEQQGHQDDGEGGGFGKIDEPELRRDRAESVFLLDDKGAVEAEGNIEKNAHEIEDAEKKNAGPDGVEVPGFDQAGDPGKNPAQQNGKQDGVVDERLQGLKPRRLDRVVPHAGKRRAVDLIPKGLRDEVPVLAQVDNVHPGESIPGESGCGKEDKEAREEGVELNHAGCFLGQDDGKLPL